MLAPNAHKLPVRTADDLGERPTIIRAPRSHAMFGGWGVRL